MIHSKFHRILTFISSNKNLLGNFFSLSLMQALNGLLPLITIPYLMRVIHADKYGLITISQAVIYYFQILTDYGFNLSGTRQIAVFKNNTDRISSIFSAIIYIKILLTLAGVVLLSALVYAIPSFRENALLFYLTYLTVVGHAFFPTWFFQGIEKMKYLTILNLISKVVFTLLIFLLVKTENDYLMVPVFTGLGFIISTVLGIWIAIRYHRVKFVRTSPRFLRYQFRDGFPLFISNFSISFYRSANPIILGWLTNNTVVGYYSVAEKLIKGIQLIVNSLSQALFPFLSRKLDVQKDMAQKLRTIILPSRLIGICLVLVGLFIAVTAPFWIRIFTHTEDPASILCLRIMAAVIPVGGINYILGFIGLINLNSKKQLMTYVTLSGAVAIVSVTLLSGPLESLGAAIAMLLAEVVLLSCIGYKFHQLYRREELLIKAKTDM